MPKTLLLIAILATLFFIVEEIYFFATNNSYMWDFIVVMPLLWGIYAIRKKIALIPTHYIAFILLLVFHSLGGFGAYEQSFIKLPYDVYMHTYGGFVGGILLTQAFTKKSNFQGWKKYLAIIICILALGAAHEILEYFAVVIGNKDIAWLFDGPLVENILDTQEDLINNTIGCVLAIIFYDGLRYFNKHRLKSK